MTLRRACVLVLSLSCAASGVACSAHSGEDDEGEGGELAESALTASIGAGAMLETTTNLRLREAPSRNARTLTVIERGARVIAIDGTSRDGFYEVEVRGKRGFCHGAFLKLVSSSGSASPRDSGSGDGASHEGRRARWQPRPGTTWQWQLQGSLDTTVDVAAYDIDLWDTSKSTIESLHAMGRKVICYFSAGSYENWRADASQFPAAAKGKVMDGWPNERWLDVRSSKVRSIMQQRLDLAADKGCDAVEPDNVDGYSNESGFALSGADQIAFNRFLATEAHARGLAIGLKNDLDQVQQLVASFDFAVNEQCFQYGECDSLKAFIEADKPVLQVEYGSASLVSTICPKANQRNFDTLIKRLDLGAWRVACR